MPRPPKVVKNELSVAIAELRRRLGHSQQSWANLLGLSIGAVARWELNQRPSRITLKRLVEIAMAMAPPANDLEDVLYREYEREFGLSLQSPFASELDSGLEMALDLLTLIGVENPDERRKRVRAAKLLLQGLRKRVKDEFPGLPIVVKLVSKDKKQK